MILVIIQALTASLLISVPEEYSPLWPFLCHFPYSSPIQPLLHGTCGPVFILGASNAVVGTKFHFPRFLLFLPAEHIQKLFSPTIATLSSPVKKSLIASAVLAETCIVMSTSTLIMITIFGIIIWACLKESLLYNP